MPPKKSSATTTSAAAVAPVAVKEEKPPAVVSEPEVVEVETEDLATAYATFSTKLVALRQGLASLMTDFKTLQKRAEREVKAAQKVSNRRKNPNRAPSGFVKPTLISDQLAEFLSKSKGAMVARTEVTREINAYIRANKLQDPTNGRKINPDAKLKKLLALKATDELTYFNLQRFMSPHFQKAAPATA
jgi:upstream activation factor subunit UAF30